VRQELRLKGISDEVIESTLNEMLPEEELAYQAGVTYTRKITESDRFEFFRRLGGFLARRGFSYDVIKPVVTRIWEERASSHSKVNDNNVIEKDNETR
jgi:regulatory protein